MSGAVGTAPCDPTSPVRVLLVDDNPAMLRQVARLLPADFDVVAALEGGAGLRAAVAFHHPDIVVLDITLPGETGIELAAAIARVGRAPKVVFLTVHGDPDYVTAAFAAGASAYVVKMRLSTDLVPALRAVLAGGRFVSQVQSPEGL
jgi:DNA-binding NarL/FixJ family response regulator